MLGFLDTLIGFAVAMLGIGLVGTIVAHTTPALLSHRGTTSLWDLGLLFRRIEPNANPLIVKKVPAGWCMRSGRGKPCLAAMLVLCGAMSTLAQTKSASGSGNMQFADLAAPADPKNPKPKLPYGQPFTISGKTTDVCLGTIQSDKTCSQKLSDTLAATTVGGKYIVAGQETPFAVSPVSGDAWSVNVAKLDENTPVTFKFVFSGKVSQTQADKITSLLLASNDFTSSLNTFLSSATSRPASDQAILASAFGQKVAQSVLDQLGTLHVAPTSADDFKKALSAPTMAGVGLFINLTAELASLRQLNLDSKTKLGFEDTLTASAAYAALKKPPSDPDLAKMAQRYTDNYDALRLQLAINVAATLSVDVGATADDITEDLKKYAGFDVGALYVPRLQELRSFATVNIYFGSVALHPENGQRLIFWERVSLSFGMALKDLSGADTSTTKIKGENAFAYGIGVRLNKYFRITTGGIVYRTQLPAINGVASPITGKLRNEFFIGPSIDVTAIPALKGIFAKAKSN
jgi:hypothetical protein